MFSEIYAGTALECIALYSGAMYSVLCDLWLVSSAVLEMKILFTLVVNHFGKCLRQCETEK
jgi:hypothetical protein